MLKFTGNRGDKTFVAFGLSAENVKRLQKDMPIVVNMAELGLHERPFDEVLIFAGDTEESMAQQVKDAGLIGPDTVVRGVMGNDAGTMLYDHPR